MQDSRSSESSSTILAGLPSSKPTTNFSRIGFSFSSSFISEESIPKYDYCRYEVAIDIVLYSTQLGIHNKSYMQFEIMYKLRSWYDNFILISKSSTY